MDGWYKNPQSGYCEMSSPTPIAIPVPTGGSTSSTKTKVVQNPDGTTTTTTTEDCVGIAKFMGLCGQETAGTTEELETDNAIDIATLLPVMLDSGGSSGCHFLNTQYDLYGVNVNKHLEFMCPYINFYAAFIRLVFKVMGMKLIIDAYVNKK